MGPGRCEIDAAMQCEGGARLKMQAFASTKALATIKTNSTPLTIYRSIDSAAAAGTTESLTGLHASSH